MAALVRMLRSCPDVVAWRKEVLVATRYVMTVMLRAGARCTLSSTRHLLSLEQRLCLSLQTLFCLSERLLWAWLSHSMCCARSQGLASLCLCRGAWGHLLSTVLGAILEGLPFPYMTRACCGEQRAQQAACRRWSRC